MLNKTILVALVAFILDRITKIYVPWAKYCNAGAAFGILEGQTLFLSLFSLAFIILLLFYAKQSNNNVERLALGMVIGGTVGNLFDRLAYGCVIDFIELKFIDFPVFNLADVFINLGIVVLLFILMRKN